MFIKLFILAIFNYSVKISINYCVRFTYCKADHKQKQLYSKTLIKKQNSIISNSKVLSVF